MIIYHKLSVSISESITWYISRNRKEILSSDVNSLYMYFDGDRSAVDRPRNGCVINHNFLGASLCYAGVSLLIECFEF